MALTKSSFYFSFYKNKLVEILKNPKLVGFYFGRLSSYSKTDDVDLFVVSYPKSGRTWLQNILREIGASSCDLNQEISDSTSIVDSLKILGENDSKFPKILATHAGSSWEQIEGLFNEEEIKKDDFEYFGNKKTLFLYRDPRDVLVSQFYHMSARNGIKNITKEDLISNEIIGLKKIIFFMNKWYEFSLKHTDQIIKMSYEDLKKDTVRQLKKLMHFIDLDVNECVVEDAIEQSDIKKMQKKQSASSNNDPWTKTSDVKNKNSFQSRKGLIGEHAEFFNSQEVATINKIIKEHLHPSFNYSNEN